MSDPIVATPGQGPQDGPKEHPSLALRYPKAKTLESRVSFRSSIELACLP